MADVAKLLRDWAEECRYLAKSARTEVERDKLLREAGEAVVRADVIDATQQNSRQIRVAR